MCMASKSEKSVGEKIVWTRVDRFVKAKTVWTRATECPDYSPEKEETSTMWYGLVHECSKRDECLNHGSLCHERSEKEEA